uniref:Chorismate synthase n=1 Tax=Magnetococcus massalia (strain MO-1) TaxID=451514 RepID=A0A1S7LKU4_MAGMO|nr:chorismate synthase (5-enolpyruvylshikimate-3-phosphate phospholyase) [Candidatus Magnetococcus massalia]
MSGSIIGSLFQLSTFGESHGVAIGGVVDGCPAGLPLCEADLQVDLDRRRPGQSRFTTQRQEADQVKILSGVFEGKTTGTPIGFIIENSDQRSKDYSEIKDRFRPGHADFTYQQKYGHRDYRGGGRSSARETAIRVAGGAIAKKLLQAAAGIQIRGALVGMGDINIDPSRWDWESVGENPFFCPDPGSVEALESSLDAIRKAGDSVGAMLEVHAQGVPAGLGEPVFDRLDADLAKSIMAINAVKGVEIGAGMAAAQARGSTFADEMEPGEDAAHPHFLRNNAGGILGGISSGAPILIRFSVKPTSSILIPRKSVDRHGNACEVVTKGRHDPCVGIRAVPVAEAMVALTLADHWLRWRAAAPIDVAGEE